LRKLNKNIPLPLENSVWWEKTAETCAAAPWLPVTAAQYKRTRAVSENANSQKQPLIQKVLNIQQR